MNRSEAFKILEIDEASSEKEIKKAYRKMSSKYHPDKNKDENATSKMSDINAAYDLLTGKTKEDFNDNQSGQFWENFGFRHRGRNAEWGQWDRNMMFRGEDYRLHVSISMEDIYHGTSKTITFNGQEITLEIPKGISVPIKLTGKGGRPKQDGADHGDLYVYVSPSQHELFSLSGSNLILNLFIDLPTALFGGKVRIPTIDGQIDVVIPGGVNTGQQLNIRDKGIYPATSMICILHVDIPNLSGKKEEFLDKTNDIMSFIKSENVEKQKNKFDTFLKNRG